MESPRPPTDTVAAIATAPGRAGVGVVRVSGPATARIAAEVTGRTLVPRRATLSDFVAADGQVLDRGLAVYFPGPRSYTGEDVLELQGHGGPVVLRSLVRRCVQLGARLAEPGEFTRRAFLNDKLDLAQAEAVADLIDASTEAAARSAMRSLSGAFSAEIERLDQELVDLRSLVEATLDFPDEEVDFLSAGDAAGRLARLEAEVSGLLERAQRGAILRTGLHVVLAGQPNVGKSSLLNRLAREERAIVTPVAGTTRDALRETIQVAGIPLHVIDTAGLRETDDEVERIGVERSWKEIRRADLVVLMCDARVGVTDRERAIASRLPIGLVKLTVFNKIDLVERAAWRGECELGVCIGLSASRGEGIELLEQEFLRVAGWHDASGEDVYLARERHLSALLEVRTRLRRGGVEAKGLELLAEELRLAHEALQSITGAFSSDDLLGTIFSRFCIGK